MTLEKNNIHNQSTSGWLLPVIALSLMLLLITKGHNWGDDFAVYIMQAQALVDGTVPQLIRDNSFTVLNSTGPVGPIAYPWGFPALLAPAYAMFGTHLFAFKLVGAAFYLLFLLYLWHGFGRPLAESERMFLLAVFSLNPILLGFVNNIGSDRPFLFFSTLSLGLMSVAGHESPGRLSLRLVALGFAMGAAYLIRTNGILLPIVYVLLVIWGFSPPKLRARCFDSTDCLAPVRGHPLPMQLALFVLPLLVFALMSASVAAMLPDGQRSHVSLLADVSLQSIGANIAHYSFLMTDFFFPFEWGRAIGAGFYAASAIFVVRGIKIAKYGSLHMLLYAAATLAMFVLWPFRQGVRFIFPLLPIYVFFLSIGLFRNPQKMARLGGFSKALATLLPAVFFIVSASMVLRNFEKGSQPPDGPYTQSASEMLTFIRNGTRPDEVVAFRKPRALRMLANRNSLRILDLENIGKFDIYVVDKTKRSNQLSQGQRELLFRQQNAERIFENRDFDVFRLMRN